MNNKTDEINKKINVMLFAFITWVIATVFIFSFALSMALKGLSLYATIALFATFFSIGICADIYIKLDALEDSLTHGE